MSVRYVISLQSHVVKAQFEWFKAMIPRLDGTTINWSSRIYHLLQWGLNKCHLFMMPTNFYLQLQWLPTYIESAYSALHLNTEQPNEQGDIKNQCEFFANF